MKPTNLGASAMDASWLNFVYTFSMLHIVWEFVVKPGRLKEFEQHYSSAGTWVQLFRKGQGYLETICVRDTQNQHRYLVVDRWETLDAFGEFKIRFAEEYGQLDQQCSAFTMEERQIGYFEG